MHGIMKNQGISVKLLINSLIFLVPLVVLFGFFWSGVSASIRFNSLELAGNRLQAPLEEVLFELGNLEKALRLADSQARQAAMAKLDAALEAYGLQERLEFANLRLADHQGLTGTGLAALWQRIKAGQHQEIPAFQAGLLHLIAYVGNTSNLILDPDLDSYYLMDVTLLALPQSQDRLRQIEILGSACIDQGFVAADQGLQLAILAALLEQSDFQRILASSRTALAEDRNFYGLDQALQSRLPEGLAAWKTATQGLIQLLASAGTQAGGVLPAAVFQQACDRARLGAFNYWNLCRQILDGLLQTRVTAYEQTRLWGVILTGLALVLAALVAWLVLSDISRAMRQTLARGASLAAGNLVAGRQPDRRDEIGRIQECLETLRRNFQSILSSEIAATVRGLNGSMATLTAGSQEISASSSQQAAAVREIIATMEDSDRLAKEVAEKINQVAGQADETRNSVDTGLSLVRVNQQAMLDIRDSNEATIRAIQDLDDRIENISAVVDMINSITSQIRIIAFNAELEAGAAGGSGRNFEIVATEIRRLADRSSASTGEIKQTIGQIQAASRSLVEAARGGTRTMERGRELSLSLEDLFDGILQATDHSAGSASQIAVLIGEQVAAFGQILLSLRQISDGTDSFVTATKGSSQSAVELRQMAGELQRILGKFQLEQPGA